MADEEKQQSGDHHEMGHRQTHSSKLPQHSDALGHVRTNIDVIEVTQQNPYFELNFIGTYLAITLATGAAFAGYVMPVTSLAYINDAIGPSANDTWISLGWVLTSSVGFTLVGRLSDIFGRRWFFTSCSAIATIGCTLSATANNINQVIGASVLLGWGAAGQISFNYVLGEIVPVRHRYAANGIVFLMTLPYAGIGPYIARLFIVHTSVGWRGSYYVALALDATATIAWLLFYHPPKFENIHRNRTKMDEVKELDFGGIILFTGGLLLFLLGLSWGGEVHPWKSAYTLATLVTGAIILVIFVLYETYMPLRRPLIPMHLFRNYDYVIVTILSTVGGMVYYSMSVLFPAMAEILYTTSIVEGGLISCAIGGGVCAGQFIGSFIAVPGGHMRLKVMFITAGLCAFIGGLAGATHSQAIGSALAVCGGLTVGMLEVMVSTTVTIILDDQSEMGTGAGVFGSLRAAGGVVATAIYVSILDNRVNANIKTKVAPALATAGLSPSKIPAFIAALAAGDTAKLAKLAGGSTAIIDAGALAFKQAYEASFKTVFLATIAFGGLAFVASWFHRDIDASLTHDVIRRLAPSRGTVGDKTEYGEKISPIGERGNSVG